MLEKILNECNNLIKDKSSKIPSNIQRKNFDTIFLNPDDYEENKGKNFVLVCSENHCLNVIAVPHEEIEKGHYYVNTTLSRRIGEGQQPRLCEYKPQAEFKFTTVKVQELKFIQDDCISVTPQVFDNISQLEFDFFIVYNRNDSSHFILNKKHIRKSTGHDNSSIKLSRKQRLMLNINIEKDDVQDIVLLPIIQKIPKNNSLSRKILSIYVGKVNYSLIVKRPLSTDETFNIVRLSRSNMKLLGVADTDILNISYKGKSVKVRALEFDDINGIKEANADITNDDTMFDINLIIAMPAFVRDKLEIPTVASNVAVKVERDMKYIWDKNISKQILPIILILFSTEMLSNLKGILQKAIFSLLALPIVLYFNLSSERIISKEL